MAGKDLYYTLGADTRDSDTKLRDTKAKLAELTDKVRNVKLGVDDKGGQVKLKELSAQLDKLDKRRISPTMSTASIDKFDLAVDKASLKLDKLDLKSDIAGGSVTGLGKDLGAMSNYAIPAAIAGVTALAGQIAVLGTGLGGFALAALAVVKNQKLMAQTLAPLKAEYAGFSKALQPDVLSVFNKGVSTADHLLGDLEPVSKATGKALSGVMSQVDKEFQSGVWQNFFGFMEKQAGPDVQQLGMLFTDLLDAIPPITEALHPFGAVLINDADSVIKFAGGVGALTTQAEKLAHISTAAHANGLNSNSAATRGLTGAKNAVGNLLNPVQGAVNLFGQIGDKLKQFTDGENAGATAAQKTALAVQKEKQSMDALAASMSTVIDKTLQLQGGDIAWHQAMNDATAALKQNHDALAGNSNAALADKQALLQSTDAAIKNAQSQVHLNHNTSAASAIINKQIAYLQQHGQKSEFAAQEIYGLVSAEKHLPANITSKVHVDTTTAAYKLAGLQRMLSILNGEVVTTYVSTQFVGGASGAQGRIRRAQGGPVPGFGNSDTVPALLTPGEAVVPKRLVPAVAPFLKSQGVPGFDMGGFVGSLPPMGYSGAQSIVLEVNPTGTGLDNMFMSWLSNAIRVRGGDASVLVTKRKI